MKRASDKQILWHKRNGVFFRLKGASTGILHDKSIFTEKEYKKLKKAFKLIQEVLDNFKDSNITLGFKTKKKNDENTI